MQASIGRGVSRTRIILCKIITCVAVSILIFTCLAVFLCLLGLVMGAKMTARDLAILLLCVLKAAYCTAGYAPIAAVIIYLTDNKALSVFINVVLLLFLPLFLTLLEQSVLFANLHPSRYTLEGFACRGFSDLLLTGRGAGMLIFGFLIHMLIAFLLSTLVFARKELDF